jgi:hypothetical protein
VWPGMAARIDEGKVWQTVDNKVGQSAFLRILKKKIAKDGKIYFYVEWASPIDPLHPFDWYVTSTQLVFIVVYFNYFLFVFCRVSEDDIAQDLVKAAGLASDNSNLGIVDEETGDIIYTSKKTYHNMADLGSKFGTVVFCFLYVCLLVISFLLW